MFSHQISLAPLNGNRTNCPNGADEAFGPLIKEPCRSFDFTLKFEQTVLSLLPSTLFLLLAMFRLYILRRAGVKVSSSYLSVLKAVRLNRESFNIPGLPCADFNGHLGILSVDLTSFDTKRSCPSNIGINSFRHVIICGRIGNLSCLLR